MTRPAHEIASDYRKEALRLYGEAGRIQDIALMLEGTHHSIPEEHRASHEEILSRMTLAERKRYDELTERWEKRNQSKEGR